MCSPLNTIFIQSPECPCGKSVKWWCGWWWLRIKRPREWTRKEWIKLHSSASKLHIVWMSFGPGGIRIIHIGQSPVECIVIIIVSAVSFFVVCPERRREVAGDGYSINIKSPQSSFWWWCCWFLPVCVCTCESNNIKNDQQWGRGESYENLVLQIIIIIIKCDDNGDKKRTATPRVIGLVAGGCKNGLGEQQQQHYQQRGRPTIIIIFVRKEKEYGHKYCTERTVIIIIIRPK